MGFKEEPKLVELSLSITMTDLHAYGTIYLSMLLVALVMPEEPALLAWGLAVGAWQLHPLWALVAAVLGVLSTDLGLYSVGRFGGRPLLERMGLERWLSHQRRETIEQGFRKSGTLWLITARLLPIPGLRTGVFVSAGILHYPWWRFVLCDTVFLGLVGGILVVGGYYCADAIGRWLQGFDTLRYWVLVMTIIVSGGLLVWKADSWLGRLLSRKALGTAARCEFRPSVSEPNRESSQPSQTNAIEQQPRTAYLPDLDGQMLCNGSTKPASINRNTGRVSPNN